jgi:hypothetical protein
LRNLVCQFRARCQADRLPPFSPDQHADAPAVPVTTTPQHVPKSPRSPIATRSP